MPAVARGERPGRGAPSAERGRATRKPAARGAARPAAKSAAPPQRSGLSPLAALNAAGAIIAIGLFAVLFTGDRASAGVQAAVAAVDQQLAAAGMKVEAVHLQGVSPHARRDILNAGGVLPGDPILGVDLEAVRARVEATGWAKSVTVMRMLPASLVISVVENTHLAVWQHGGKTVVIDTDGQVLANADPGAFPDLPLVVGAGAPEHAAAILPLIRARPRLTERLEALVRVDGRRWDLRLNDGALIQLPAVGEDSALIQLDTLDGRSRLLELGFAKIDLRDPDMVAVRPKPAGDPAADKMAIAKFAAAQAAAVDPQN
jgi:cell division protein FtsQ